MIYFHSESINFKVKNPIKIKRWLKTVIKEEDFELSELNYVFCDDAYLHKINLEYLNHDTLTDIITFDNSEEEKSIESDIFISIERITDNAEDFKTTFEHEFRRVIVHGILHLCGYNDKTEQDQKFMRTKEEYYISLFS
jgi:rRNA maturation RNase YbeY